MIDLISVGSKSVGVQQETYIGHIAAPVEPPAQVEALASTISRVRDEHICSSRHNLPKIRRPSQPAL